MSAERSWSRVVDQLLESPDVSSGRMFSSEGLRYGDKYFAMLCRGDLVVKLPAARVDQLEGSGAGQRFDPGHGRIMREWLAVPVSGSRRWRTLAAEALQFAQHNAADARNRTARSRSSG